MDDRQTARGTLPFDWWHTVSDIGASGLEVKRSASVEERVALVRALELVDCAAVTAEYRLRRLPDDCYRLEGVARAEVVQACVVTLQPVHERIEAILDVEFRPAEDGPGGGHHGLDLDDGPEIEPIEGNRLAVGRIVFEELATGLNPYPRSPGAGLEEAGNEAERERRTASSPFAVLQKLKRLSGPE